jgi:hypothetical protein
MVCANSSRINRPPSFLIRKYKNPKAFENVKRLPELYINQGKAWMTGNLFLD